MQERLKRWREWTVIRGLLVSIASVGIIVAGFALNREVAVVAGVFLLLIGLYFADLESVTAGVFGAKSRRRLAQDVAAAAHVRPGSRGLSEERIEAEVALYDAILRLQTAVEWQHVTIPHELDEEIARFWRLPESVGMRPGGEEDVRDLTRRVLEFVSPELRPSRADGTEARTEGGLAERAQR